MSSATIDSQRLRAALTKATTELLAERNAQGFWEGELSSSALSTATAVTALAVAGRESQISNFQSQIDYGLRWLAEHQNADGGWGDTTKSLSNISTTTLGWAAFGAAGADEKFAGVVGKAERWLEDYVHAHGPVSDAGGNARAASAVVGDSPRSARLSTLPAAIIARYGKDRTFSVPILTMCALSGRLGEGRAAWRHVIPLPFELAACPHQLFAALRLPVVSYALPALIAIGQARHVHAPSRNPLVRLIRNATREKTLRKLTEIQPTNGGFLEATPLTGFVTMSLAGSGQADHVVTQRGLEFLLKSQRVDGSWPIDTNLSTWCSTLAVNALDKLFREYLYEFGHFENGLRRNVTAPAALRKDEESVVALARWLLGQQFHSIHPYTRSAPGGWAWTDLPGGVPDADDTSGAILALGGLRHRWFTREELEQLGVPDHEEQMTTAMRHGVNWLLGLQNRDGGFPTFCRGWGALPFDRSSPDITAHAMRALVCEREWQHDERWDALERATLFLIRSQHEDGSWVPLWFGNQFAGDEVNKVYGTSRVLLGLVHGRALEEELKPARRRGLAWLCAAQHSDGSWGGNGQTGTIEETALAVEALASITANHGDDEQQFRPHIERGTQFLMEAVESGAWREPSPIGFYFAKLWYFERLYPMIFTVAALREAAPWLGVYREES